MKIFLSSLIPVLLVFTDLKSIWWHQLVQTLLYGLQAKLKSGTTGGVTVVLPPLVVAPPTTLVMPPPLIVAPPTYMMAVVPP